MEAGEGSKGSERKREEGRDIDTDIWIDRLTYKEKERERERAGD